MREKRKVLLLLLHSTRTSASFLFGWEAAALLRGVPWHPQPGQGVQGTLSDTQGQLKAFKLNRQRQLQDHRKVLCELGVTVKKNVGKLARKNRVGGKWEILVTIYERQELCDRVKGKLIPTWHQGDSWLFIPHSASSWAQMSTANPPAAQGLGNSDFSCLQCTRPWVYQGGFLTQHAVIPSVSCGASRIEKLCS